MYPRWVIDLGLSQCHHHLFVSWSVLMERKFSSGWRFWWVGLLLQVKLPTGMNLKKRYPFWQKDAICWTKPSHLSCRFRKIATSFFIPICFKAGRKSWKRQHWDFGMNSEVWRFAWLSMIIDNVDLSFAQNYLVCCPRDFLVGKDRCGYVWLICDIVINCWC